MKQRLVDTKFWTDGYICNLDPVEKLLFLYVITNPLTNISGIYEIQIKQIAFDCGLDKEAVKNILERFEKDGKIRYENGWIAIKNFLKHQNQGSSKVKTGIEREFSAAPENLQKWSKYGIDTLSDPNSNLNSNLNSNSNGKSDTLSDSIRTLWIKTFGRNPKIPEREITERLIKKWGYDHVAKIMKEATLKNFKSILTLENSLDENGNIKGKENGNYKEQKPRGSIDFDKYNSELSTIKSPGS